MAEEVTGQHLWPTTGPGWPRPGYFVSAKQSPPYASKRPERRERMYDTYIRGVLGLQPSKGRKPMCIQGVPTLLCALIVCV